MRAVPGLVAFLVGAALLAGLVVVNAAEERLPSGDHAGHGVRDDGVFVALPESWPRLRTLSFALFMATFGFVSAALTLTPLHFRARRDVDHWRSSRLRQQRADAVVGVHRCRLFCDRPPGHRGAWSLGSRA